MRYLVLLLIACGPVEPPCLVDSVHCESRCLSVCRPEGWEVISCLPCGESLLAAGAGGTYCHIAGEACVVAP